MSYRCQICDTASKKGAAQQKHIILKPGTRDIDREIPVCSTCAEALAEGMTLEELRRFYRPAPPPVNKVKVFGEQLQNQPMKGASP